MAEEEKSCAKRIEKEMRIYQKTKREALEKKKENTRIIVEITGFGEKQLQLNKDLEQPQHIFKEKSQQKQTNLSKDKRNLKELVGFFEQEIENLRYEIGLFKRKGGHLYT